MNEKWEFRKVSTPERIFDQIKKEASRPIGIILFGADCDFKNEVCRKIRHELGKFVYCYDRTSSISIVKALKDYPVVVMTMNSDDSSAYDSREGLMRTMLFAGAITTVGVYAKAQKKSARNSKLSREARTKLNQQISAIEKSNPTTNMWTYFIVADEKEE